MLCRIKNRRHYLNDNCKKIRKNKKFIEIRIKNLIN